MYQQFSYEIEMLEIQYHLKPLSEILSRPLNQEMIERVARAKNIQLVNGKCLPFGKLHSDHMFLMLYSPENGWHDAKIVPYGPIGKYIPIMPCSDEYTNRVFEGSKAFLHPDGELYTFRFDQNAARLNRSAKIVSKKIP